MLTFKLEGQLTTFLCLKMSDFWALDQWLKKQQKQSNFTSGNAKAHHCFLSVLPDRKQ